MTRREAIEALEYLISGECTDTQMDYVDEIRMAINDMKICEANNTICAEPITYNALELLKAQEPRVMMADEVEKWVRQKPIDREPIYVEVKDSFCAWMVNDYCGYLPETDLSPELYGKTWRVWSAKPTDAERKAVAWND